VKYSQNFVQSSIMSIVNFTEKATGQREYRKGRRGGSRGGSSRGGGRGGRRGGKASGAAPGRGGKKGKDKGNASGSLRMSRYYYEDGKPATHFGSRHHRNLELVFDDKDRVYVSRTVVLFF
jgi:hypothetical protein